LTVPPTDDKKWTTFNGQYKL